MRIFFRNAYLLVCGMKESAQRIILNSLHFIEAFGIVPNGARVYYLDRSQPPLLSEMVLEYYEATKDNSFLAKVLPSLDKEYQFWMTKRAVAIQIGDGKTYTLNQYNAQTSQPRPESFKYVRMF